MSASGNTHDDLFPFGDGERGFGRLGRGTTPVLIDETINPQAGNGERGLSYVGTVVGAPSLRIFFGIIAVSLALILERAGTVQIAQGDYYAGRAESNRSIDDAIPAERGVIFDRNGTPLVRNASSFGAGVDASQLPADAEERKKTIAKISDLLGIQPYDLERRIALDAKGPIVVSDGLPQATAMRVDVESAATPGLSLVVGTRRDYVHAADVPSLSHLLGYESRVTERELQTLKGYGRNDDIGKTGLERYYEQTLRGQFGKRQTEQDVRQNRRRVIAEEPPIPGANLVLAIDLDLQKYAENALRRSLRAAGKTRGSVIVMQPKTGEVLALVSLPAYDDNAFSKGIDRATYAALANNEDRPLFPRAIAASLPSGSTFKPTVAAAALEEKLITPTTSVVSTGGISVGAWFFPDWKPGGHGVTDVRKAIAESVNTFFYTIGGGYEGIKGLGPEKIAAYARKFGFGSALGIDLPGEGAGFLPSKEWKKRTKNEPWYIGDTYHLAIGQGDILVTPLQIAEMTAVFANGGSLVRPHVVNGIMTADGKRIPREPEVLAAQVVSTATIQVVREGMRRAVTAGSARSLGDLPVEVAAKTGTAQWRTGKATHAWFTSFAPYDDPKLVVTVNIEEGGEGSHSAAPVAKDIYAWYFGGRKAASTAVAEPDPSISADANAPVGAAGE